MKETFCLILVAFGLSGPKEFFLIVFSLSLSLFFLLSNVLSDFYFSSLSLSLL